MANLGPLEGKGEPWERPGRWDHKSESLGRHTPGSPDRKMSGSKTTETLHKTKRGGTKCAMDALP